MFEKYVISLKCYFIILFAFLCFFWKIHESDTEEEEDDTIHMGNAIMTFYAALIDLLGRCAPEMHVSVLESRNKNPGLSLSVKRSVTDNTKHPKPVIFMLH